LSVLAPVIAFVALTAANAFFVVGEFSLVTADRATIAQSASAGDRKAKIVQRSLHQLSFQLSAAQLGITLAALLTGYIAAPAFAPAIRPLIAPWAGANTNTIVHLVSLAIATLLSMLFGELVPKNAALARPNALVRASAGPVHAFSRACSPIIKALNNTANFIVRRLGVEPQEELASARSPEELGLLAAISARAGAIPEDTAVLLRRSIRFGDKRAAEAMTPRVDVLGLAVDATVSDLLHIAQETGHSKFPVYDGSLDHIMGIASVTDALGIPPARRDRTAVTAIARDAIQVPESLDLGDVLAALNAGHADMAIVVDEYGGTDGVVTIEDLVEELVGEIADEHDPRSAGEVDIVAADLTAPIDGTILVDGMLREDELAEKTGFTLPDGPYETLAGFLMAELGRIPVAGEVVTVPGWEFTVVEVERRRIEQVRVARTGVDEDES
jgi:CBS domain containing-hemolysin-like protein